MPKTPAQRQAAYRQKHLHEVESTKLIVDHGATLALSRLAIRYGVTKTELLVQLILDEQDWVLSTMSGEETKCLL